MNESPLLRGRDYLMKIGTKTVTATISPLKYKINVNTLEHIAGGDARAQRHRRVPTCSSTARSRSILTRSTATRAGSS